MYFEGRELNPYWDPISADLLVEHETYFMVSFIDSELHVPSLEPIVFVGFDLEAGDDGVAYFQDVDSYGRGVRYESCGEKDEAHFVIADRDELSNFFDFDGALDQILRCSLRRGSGRG